MEAPGRPTGQWLPGQVAESGGMSAILHAAYRYDLLVRPLSSVVASCDDDHCGPHECRSRSRSRRAPREFPGLRMPESVPGVGHGSRLQMCSESRRAGSRGRDRAGHVAIIGAVSSINEILTGDKALQTCHTSRKSASSGGFPHAMPRAPVQPSKSPLLEFRDVPGRGEGLLAAGGRKSQLQL